MLTDWVSPASNCYDIVVVDRFEVRYVRLGRTRSLFSRCGRFGGAFAKDPVLAMAGRAMRLCKLRKETRMFFLERRTSRDALAVVGVAGRDSGRRPLRPRSTSLTIKLVSRSRVFSVLQVDSCILSVKKEAK